MTTTSNKQERVKLITNVQEREHYETLAELYSVIYATEKLEKAFIRDSISQEDYTQQCLLLIQKFKSLRNIINMSVDEFMEKYKLNCPAAKHRLMVMGAPETVKKDKVGKVSGKDVAECTQYFITLMDTLKLEMKSVDQIYPQLTEVVNSINRIFSTVTEIDRKYPEKKILINWLSTLNSMKADDDLDESQTRQLSFDLDRAYNKFHQVLEDI
jgi:ESCRT-I complex subunit VPS28